MEGGEGRERKREREREENEKRCIHACMLGCRGRMGQLASLPSYEADSCLRGRLC